MYIYIYVYTQVYMFLECIYIYIIQMVPISTSIHVCSISAVSLFIGCWGTGIGRTCGAHESESVYAFFMEGYCIAMTCGRVQCDKHASSLCSAQGDNCKLRKITRLSKHSTSWQRRR